MVAPAVIALIIVASVAVLLFIIALALFIATANQLDAGSGDRTPLLAAGAMMGIAIPFIIVGAIFGVIRFSALNKGEKKAGALWAFIIFSAIGGILVFVATIIGFAIGSHYDDDKRRNLFAASALSLIGALLFMVAFLILLIFVKPNKKQGLTALGRKQIAAPVKSEKPGFAASSVVAARPEVMTSQVETTTTSG